MTLQTASLFEPGKRHLVVLAHQDDELPYAGLLSRMDRPEVVFVTNGDGLHFELDMEPEPYAALRRAESVSALGRLGIGEDQIRFMDWSELTFYAEFGRMSALRRPAALDPMFDRLAGEIDGIVNEVEPDVVWTMAWQGGNPEHDLTHLCVSRAVAALQHKRGAGVPFLELPAYELLLIVMRFAPWYAGTQHEISLTEAELDAKKELLEMYPTQERVITELRRAIDVVGRLSRLRGRQYTFDDFGRREVFGAVPAARDCTKSTHISPRLDYPFDDWKGQRIRFERTLARIAAEWAPSLY